MNGDHTIRCYAVRRVNPFLGVLQIIETPDGKALSANGVVWDIEPSAPADYQDDTASADPHDLAYYRYGLWSREEGLVQRPLAALHGEDRLKRQAEALVDRVSQYLDRLPFPLADSRELWLFDAANERPIALLDSCLPGEEPAPPHSRRWQSSLGENGVAGQRRYPAARELESLVRQRAGFNTNTAWVSRNDAGTGYVDGRDEALSTDRFPSLLLTRTWTDPAHRALVEGFLDWTAPSLLTLQHLGRDLRARLEGALQVQAQSVEHHWRLYPETLDSASLTTARVQCRLQRSG